MAPFRQDRPAVHQDADEASSLSSCADEGDLTNNTTSSKFHTSDDNYDDEDGHKEIQAQLTKKETAAVFKIRVIVILVLMLVATAVSVIVYRITKGGETEEFKTQWEGSSQKVLIAFADIVHQMGAVSGLGVAIIAHGVDHFRDWPFVTLSSFQQRSGNVRALSKALFVSIAPRVALEQFEDWDSYIQSEDNYWISEGLEFQKDEGLVGFEDPKRIQSSVLDPDRKVDMMHYFDQNENVAKINKAAPFYLPVWQTSPVLETGFINEDQMQPHGALAPEPEVVSIVLDNATAVIGGFTSARPGSIHSTDKRTALFATLRSMAEKKEVEYFGDPMAQIFLPIFDSFNRTTRKPVALITALVHWRAYFRDILPANIKGVDVVLENTCDGFFTFQISGNEAFVIGSGDHHNPDFDKWGRDGEFSAKVLDDGTRDGLNLHQDGCTYKVHVYPSQLFWYTYNTDTPLIVTCSIVAVFMFTILMFLFYDFLVERRQKVVLHQATQSTAIVSSLFPKNVRDRLINGAGTGSVTKRDSFSLGNKSRLKGFLDGNSDDEKEEQAPIADLFPECTVFFGDIAGFTAWSSTREPSQVFILLQTVYQAFDFLAKRRKVFKVETIGDSYMAVTGLPEPQQNHAVIMVRFAYDCLQKMNEITKNLESTLGPDTNDLAMRFGLNSGPVTAGVLRGDRARFQLFGDTVNTASRMESTGQKSKIQISQTTADALIEGGKAHWLKQRKETVTAKGKGNLITFWANPASRGGSSNAASVSAGSEGSVLLKGPDFKPVNDRLVDWMVDMLLDSVKKIVHARRQCRVKDSSEALAYKPLEGATCMDEVKEVIAMPNFNAKITDFSKDYASVWISPKAIDNLRSYVHAIASLYRNNPFHNFEHACHVSMSVIKLLKRIVAPDLTPEQLEKLKKNQLARDLHDFTHGINSDPMGVFAIIFSALIHDVDHRGVSNMQLIEEAPEMANRYSNQSIAEQNSVDMAWDLLMEDQFQELRKLLFASQSDLMRFRQMCVNVVLATDIFDKELAALRKSRWAKAFPDHGTEPEQKLQSPQVDLRRSGTAEINGDLRATIVIEHIIQASDVSHTMQHWHIYRKWNEKLFTEMYAAFRAGRMAKDPATFWYKGEIGFFDNYVIPLAKKLKECGVFGVSSAEFLNYAVQNRAEWEERGQEIVTQLSESLAAHYDATTVTLNTQMNSSISTNS